MNAPLFSVIMATFNREQHIRPSIASVLRQTFHDFELIVVSDGPAVANHALRAAFPDNRISWHELALHSGSQAAPNNRGIAAARGTFIAYLGHDDIWSAAHLQVIAQTFAAAERPDVVVSGCLYHGPPGTGIRYASGFFEPHEEDAKLSHFFPPSSVAHRKNIMQVTGPWRDPRTTAAPDDADFLLRAAHAGFRFRSTQRVTVHKFAAGHRYLSYLCQESNEQAKMLRNSRLGHPADWAPEIAQAHADGRFMVMRHPDFSTIQPGALFALNRTNKGLERAALRKLVGAEVLTQGGEVRALDWYGLEPGDPPFRWSGPNPRPKILIPFSGRGKARISLRLPSCCAPSEGLEVFSAGRRLKVRLMEDLHGTSITMCVRLSPDTYTILQLHTPAMEVLDDDQNTRRGVAISDITVTPVPSGWRRAVRLTLRLREWSVGRYRRRRIV